LDYQVYSDRVMAGAKCVEEGQFEAALDIFYGLLSTDISDIDKSMMCNNLAVTCEKMGQPDEAMRWYDEGIHYEEPYCRIAIREYKGAQLYHAGRFAEAAALYREMLGLHYLSEADKARVSGSLAAAEAQLRA